MSHLSDSINKLKSLFNVLPVPKSDVAYQLEKDDKNYVLKREIISRARNTLNAATRLDSGVLVPTQPFSDEEFDKFSQILESDAEGPDFRELMATATQVNRSMNVQKI